MANNYIMQARTSDTGVMHYWTSAVRDFAGSDYDGTGTPEEVAVFGEAGQGSVLPSDANILLDSPYRIGIGTGTPSTAFHALGVVNPAIRLEETAGYYTEVVDFSSNTLLINKMGPTGVSTTIDVNPQPGSTGDQALVRFFRYSSGSTGKVSVCAADGTSSVQCDIDARGDTRLNQLYGDLTVGSASNAAALTLHNGCTVSTGAGSPEGVVTAPVGSLYTDANGGAGSTLYIKESGTGSAGWAAK